MTINGYQYLRKKYGEISFSEILFSLRVTEEYTQQEVADSIKEPVSRICDFEKGRRIPTLEQAAKLADFYGFPREFFYKRVFEALAKNAGLNLQIEVIDNSA